MADKNVKKQFKSSRKRKMATLSTGIVVGFIAIVVIFNVVLNMLVERFPMKLDVTSENIYELTDDTIDLLKTVKTNTEITVLFGEESLPAYLTEMLDNYKRYSSSISVKYIDTIKNPDYIKNREWTDLSSDAAIVVSTDLRYKEITSADLFDENSNFKGEQAISSGIIYATKDVVYDVIFITGHGEEYDNGFKGLLSNNGYKVTSSELQKAEITENTKAIFINNPLTDFTSEEIDLLDKIMTNDENYGINTFAFFSASTPKLEKLENYIAEWGIGIGNEKVVESTSNISIYTYTQSLTYSDTSIIGTAKNYNFHTFLGEARPLSILFDAKDSIVSVSSIISSSEDSIAKPSSVEIKDVYDLEKDEGDIDGPFNVVVRSKKLRYDNDNDNKELSGSLIVSGTSAISDEAFLSTSMFGNSRFIVNVLNSVSGLNETGFAIVAKTIAAEPLNASGNIVSIFIMLFVFMIPIVLIIIGVIIYMRRKHL
ncbi:MAG: hypothetical protein E7480_07780 [Ruminococcaceae bacterium]|nr:hypothetical protein [Oscillospiraceae bacterium]